MLSYYVIDTETSGLSAKYHEITQISIIRCSDKKQINEYIKIKHPERANRESLQITGRTLQDLYRTGSPAEQVITKVNQFIESDGKSNEHRCFIGHNVNFDQRFCYSLWNSLGQEFPGNLWLCTKSLTKKSATKLGILKPKLTLEASLNLLNIEPAPGKHEASSDAKNTLLLWEKHLKDEIDYLPLIKRLPQSLIKTKTLEEMLEDLESIE